MVTVHLIIIIVVSLEGNKMISVQRPKVGNLKQTRVTREFNGDEVNVTMEIIDSDIVCNQVRNFANILRAPFPHADPKSAQRYYLLDCLFALLGSARVNMLT
jgi:hypothetical protein